MQMWRWHALIFLLHLASAAATSSLGVNWGTIASHRLPNKAVVDMIRANGINKVKLFDADNQILEAFRGTNVELMIAVRNENLQEMATNPAAATNWVARNVTRFLSPTKKSVNIKYVAIGNEPFLQAYNTTYKATLYPAVKNMVAALEAAGLKDKIKATVPFNADVVMNTSPANLPSGGVFRADMAAEVTKIVELLAANGSPFTVNIYPFLSLQQNPDFPRDFAFFEGSAHQIVDDGSGAANHSTAAATTTPLVYTNVFDAAHDLAVAALTAAGYPDMEIIIGEVGWPTDGDPAATTASAQRFVTALAKHVSGGTPRRPGRGGTQTYVFGLLDEDQKSLGPGMFEPHWGIFTYDGQPKYDVDLSGSGAATLVGAKNVKYLPKRWCVFDERRDVASLGRNVDYACSHADCTTLVPGGSCSGIGDVGKASYAFNSYYQLFDQVEQGCYFDALGMVTTVKPSFGNCTFNIQLDTRKSASKASNGTHSSESASKDDSHNSASSLSLSIGALFVLMLLQVVVVAMGHH